MRRLSTLIVSAMAAAGTVAAAQPAHGETPFRVAQAPAQAPQPPANQLARTEVMYFDSWIVTCRDFRNTKNRECAAVLQLTKNDNTHQAVLSWTIGMDPSGKPTAVFQVPTGVMIAPGLELKLEKAADRKVAYTVCMPSFCTASMPVDGALVRDMTATTEAEITIEAATAQKIQFKIPMKGFKEAYAALR